MRSSVMLAAVFALVFGASGCSGLARTSPTMFPVPPRDAITFWGHACCYIDIGGVGVVTDPVFAKTLVTRHRDIPAPPRASYAGTKVILLSHAHPDHLNPATLRTFPSDAVILCPEPAAQYLHDVGHKVRVMHPGDSYDFAGGKITAVVAYHMGTRFGIHASTDGRALGYVLSTDEGTIYYSGDTGFFSGFSHVGWTYHPDIVLLNVNGHLNGTDAVRAAVATQARVIVPLHWGAYPYWIVGGSDRPRDEDVLRRGLGSRLHVLDVGRSYPLSKARPAATALH